MSRKILVLGLLGLLSLTAKAAQAQEFMVVVNDAAPNSSVSASQLAEIFQKKLSRWSNGLSVDPVDLAETAPERERFSQTVFEKSTAQVKAWWQTQLFAGRAVPPVELSNDGRVMEYVQTHAGAIGYVRTTTALVAGVRRLTVTR